MGTTVHTRYTHTHTHTHTRRQTLLHIKKLFLKKRKKKIHTLGWGIGNYSCQRFLQCEVPPFQLCISYDTFYQSQFFLQVLEPRFNVETMAQLLNIPPNKTLLRRHLATHFNLLIGAEAQHQKRDAMELPDYVLLTATAKVKVGSGFWHLIIVRRLQRPHYSTF